MELEQLMKMSNIDLLMNIFKEMKDFITNYKVYFDDFNKVLNLKHGEIPFYKDHEDYLESKRILAKVGLEPHHEDAKINITDMCSSYLEDMHFDIDRLLHESYKKDIKKESLEELENTIDDLCFWIIEWFGEKSKETKLYKFFHYLYMKTFIICELCILIYPPNSSKFGKPFEYPAGYYDRNISCYWLANRYKELSSKRAS
jgi:hypothetical protein